MSLRLRLVIAFSILSVVPLVAVTWQSYSSSTQALEEAAEQEGRALVRELGRRIRQAANGTPEGVEEPRVGFVDQASETPEQLDEEGDPPDLLAAIFEARPTRRGDVVFAVEPDGYVYARTNEERLQVEAFGNLVRDLSPGTMWLSDWIVVTTDDPAGSGLQLGIARPVREALKELQAAAVRSAGVGLLFISAAVLCVMPLSDRLTRDLSRLRHGAQRIAGGDYRARVQVSRRDEFGQLAATFNQMAEDVERHQRTAIERERIRRELELGRQIQRDMLPGAPWQRESIQIAGLMVPALEVGGDFFNYFELPGGQLALMVGDVSGKGVGAALHMAHLQASLRTRLALGQDLADLVVELDRNATYSSPVSMYATLFVGVFDPRTRLLRYVNAGHNPPVVRRSDGRLDRLVSSGLPVGLLAGNPYAERRVTLDRGSLILFYTDGCVDVENGAGVPFGTDALEQALRQSSVESADGVLRELHTAIQCFRGQRDPLDDVTMMVASIA
jgi:serine phosphatase RsbU (regulator of sigma subunit)